MCRIWSFLYTEITLAVVFRMRWHYKAVYSQSLWPPQYRKSSETSRSERSRVREVRDVGSTVFRVCNGYKIRPTTAMVEIWRRLLFLSADEGLYWRIDGTPTAPTALELEAAAYASLALMAVGNDRDAGRVLKWLNSYRNREGGFISTQVGGFPHFPLTRAILCFLQNQWETSTGHVIGPTCYQWRHNNKSVLNVTIRTSSLVEKKYVGLTLWIALRFLAMLAFEPAKFSNDRADSCLGGSFFTCVNTRYAFLQLSGSRGGLIERIESFFGIVKPNLTLTSLNIRKMFGYRTRMNGYA